jgi:cytochrome c-type biogenesis protein CcmE
MKPAHIIAIVIIVACMVVSLTTLTGAMAPHVTIPQAMQRGKDTVQVPGAIDKSTVRYDGVKGQLSFDITGIDRNGKPIVPEQRMRVVYRQPKPESFETANSVEAVGRFDGSVFRADRLLIKCPSKYGDEKPVAGK